MRILVVEDERALCETIVRSLRRLAYSVDPCYDGDTAIDLLGSERYDLVLLDLNLPGAPAPPRLAGWVTAPMPAAVLTRRTAMTKHNEEPL